MKLLFSQYPLNDYFDDSNVKLGIGWYRHSPLNKWWGFTIEFYLIWKYVSITFVSDYEAYDHKINYWKYRNK